MVATIGGKPRSRAARSGRGWSRSTIAALIACAALGPLASACSSSHAADASALPNPDAPSIGLAVDARLMGPTADLPGFDDTNGHAGIPAGGRYQIGVRKPQSLATATLDDAFPVDQVVTASFDAHGGAVDAGFGVICRMHDKNNYYRLGVGNDGTYAIQRVKDGKLTVLTGAGQWVRGATIRTTPGAFNVRAECTGDTIALFESNQPIAQVRDAAVAGNRVGVFVETFRQPGSTVQVDSLSVRAFKDRGRVTGAVALGWDALLRTQQLANRCALLDPKRAGVPASTSFVTRCGSALLLQSDPTTKAPQAMDRILRQAGATLTTVKGLPRCEQRTGIRGPLVRPTAAGTRDARARIGTVACLDLGNSTAVVWNHDLAGVIGVVRVRDGNRGGWKAFGPSWPPFAYREGPA